MTESGERQESDGLAENPDDPDDASEVYEPDDHPHPLRAQDCQALIRRRIG